MNRSPRVFSFANNYETVACNTNLPKPLDTELQYGTKWVM